MQKTSLIASMWESVLENFDKEDRQAFVGGGEEIVRQLEERVGFTLPQEFADYIRFYCPRENLGVAELFQGTSLVAFDELGSETYHDGYGIDELEFDEDSYYLVFAEDNEDALVINLRDENCPVYYFSSEDPDSTEQIAPNFAHGLFLLGYWQHLQDDNSGLEPDSPEWQEVVDTFQAKLDELAPGVTADSWRFQNLHL